MSTATGIDAPNARRIRSGQPRGLDGWWSRSPPWSNAYGLVKAARERWAKYRADRDRLVSTVLTDSLLRELFPIIDAYGARPSAQ